MAFDREQRKVFDTVAETYATTRPGYPDALIDDAIRLSGIARGGRILEVGCGPGTATTSLAARGHEVVGLELGENLAAVAVDRCRAFSDVEIVRSSFEDWSLPDEPFDLVFSASAFHWVDPAIGYAKAAAALRASGSIALCWHRHPPDDSPTRRALDGIYRTVVPEIAAKGSTESLDATLQRTIDEIDASSLFGDVTLRTYPWRAEYTADEYIRLLHTYSDHLALPGGKLDALCAAIRELIETKGGTIERPYLSVLYVASLVSVRRG